MLMISCIGEIITNISTAIHDYVTGFQIGAKIILI